MTRLSRMPALTWCVGDSFRKSSRKSGSSRPRTLPVRASFRGMIKAGPPSPRKAPPQEPLNFLKRLLEKNVQQDVTVINRTKVPLHVSKALQDFPEVACETGK